MRVGDEGLGDTPSGEIGPCCGMRCHCLDDGIHLADTGRHIEFDTGETIHRVTKELRQVFEHMLAGRKKDGHYPDERHCLRHQRLDRSLYRRMREFEETDLDRHPRQPGCNHGLNTTKGRNVFGVSGPVPEQENASHGRTSGWVGR